MHNHTLSIQHGFTLIELMIVIAILGILYSIAMPSYSEYMLKSRRADVQQIMLQNSAILERQYTRTGGYPTAFIAQNTDYYIFSYQSDGVTFNLSAAPQGTQANDSCGTLTVDHSGKQTALIDNCWNG